MQIQNQFSTAAKIPLQMEFSAGTGSELWNGKGKWAWVQLYYPDTSHCGRGIRFDFWNYQADGDAWYVYGLGSINADRTEIIPDPGVGIWQFRGAMVGCPAEPPTAGANQGNGADPIDTSTGAAKRIYTCPTSFRSTSAAPI